MMLRSVGLSGCRAVGLGVVGVGLGDGAVGQVLDVLPAEGEVGLCGVVGVARVVGVAAVAGLDGVADAVLEVGLGVVPGCAEE